MNILTIKHNEGKTADYFGEVLNKDYDDHKKNSDPKDDLYNNARNEIMSSAINKDVHINVITDNFKIFSILPMFIFESSLHITSYVNYNIIKKFYGKEQKQLKANEQNSLFGQEDKTKYTYLNIEHNFTYDADIVEARELVDASVYLVISEANKLIFDGFQDNDKYIKSFFSPNNDINVFTSKDLNVDLATSKDFEACYFAITYMLLEVGKIPSCNARPNVMFMSAAIERNIKMLTNKYGNSLLEILKKDYPNVTFDSSFELDGGVFGYGKQKQSEKIIMFNNDKKHILRIQSTFYPWISYIPKHKEKRLFNVTAIGMHGGLMIKNPKTIGVYYN